MRRLILTISSLGLGLALPGACAITKPDPLHCTNNDGDAYCAEKFPDGSRRYCELGLGECLSQGSELGCAAERPVDECYSPCGGRSTLDENSECIVTEDSSTGTSSGGTATESSGSSGESSTTGPMPCVSDEECTEPEAPFCGTTGVCGTCDGAPDPDGACAAADPLLPLCVGDSCVACTPENPITCVDTTPVCDGATNTCVPCTAHEQCGEAACNLFTGACLPAEAVVHVGGATPDFANIGDAVASFGAIGVQGTVIVHPGGSYDESVTVNGSRVIAFLAADDAAMPPRWIQSSDDFPQLTVSAGSTVLLDGMQLSTNASPMVPALHANGGRMWVDRSRIVQNAGGGINAESNAELVLRNCFVVGPTNGNAVVLDGSSASLLYTTAGGGAVAAGRARALYCQGAADADVRNSILMSADSMSEVECPGVTLITSITEAQGDLDLGWFTDYLNGDFSLTADGATKFADAAVWTEGDPPTDIDGDPRPNTDGAADFAGADVP